MATVASFLGYRIQPERREIGKPRSEAVFEVISLQCPFFPFHSSEALICTNGPLGKASNREIKVSRSPFKFLHCALECIGVVTFPLYRITSRDSNCRTLGYVWCDWRYKE